MGGPINKIAYSIGVLAAGSALVTDPASPAYAGQQMIMTAAMAAGMVPPLGMAGGLTAGLITGGLQITMPAPHGGIFVSPLASSLLLEDKGAAMGLGIAGYILAVVAGMIVRD
ncbi:hypothetical protein FQA39_LY12951 [Lamprigera yunnana]|nr:hypothetical protein FQA39_LY12951 [Lamprigera yunnana]